MAGAYTSQRQKHIDEQIAYYISSETESSFSFEYRFRREDGNYNYINDRGYIIRNELGIVIRMIGAARDITEQKQIARNVEESEQRYKIFVQQSTEGIWRIELDKPMPVSTPVDDMVNYCMSNAYIAECNDAFAKMYGFEYAIASNEESLKSELATLFSQNEKPFILEVFTPTLQNDKILLQYFKELI